MTTTVEIFDFAERYGKAEWPDGPWKDEPDKLTWVDENTDLDCMIHRNRGGALCGYVGVSEGHPWFGKDYDNVRVPNQDDDEFGDWVDVHGGLTYADFCAPETNDEGHGLCHVPQEGRPDRIWWLGFDCAHAGDISPAYDFKFGRPFAGDSYRDMAYVVTEVQRLAKQARTAA